MLLIGLIKSWTEMAVDQSIRTIYCTFLLLDFYFRNVYDVTKHPKFNNGKTAS